ncbi:MAG: hypothetical protein NWF04_09640 [Candidatus Bathyarchaeota archaeon]|nr:hypothetical protein [Candidatus Bathyarchaeota archaeon]
MALDDPITIMAIAAAATIAVVSCVIVIYTRRRQRTKPVATAPTPEKNEPPPPYFDPQLSSGLPFRLSKSIKFNDATNAKDELRILDLEREILADAIRHLYEAHAEGKITEQERERLASSYKNRMMSVKESIAKDETIVALHELESMQEDLMKMFSSRFGELSSKVDELRGRIDIKPVREIKVQVPKRQIPVVPEQMEKEYEEEEPEETEATEEAPEKPKRKRKSSSEKQHSKTEAEQRIDAIRNQIDEVMNKLGQMEVES